MAFFLILLLVVVIFAFRKRIAMCLQNLEGPIGRMLHRNRRPSSGTGQQGPHYNQVQDQRANQQGYPNTHIPPNQHYSQPPLYGYPQQGYPQQGDYPQQPITVMSSQASMDDEHRAQRTQQLYPYGASLSNQRRENGEQVNPYIR